MGSEQAIPGVFLLPPPPSPRASPAHADDMNACLLMAARPKSQTLTRPAASIRMLGLFRSCVDGGEGGGRKGTHVLRAERAQGPNLSRSRGEKWARVLNAPWLQPSGLAHPLPSLPQPTPPPRMQQHPQPLAYLN